MRMKTNWCGDRLQGWNRMFAGVGGMDLRCAGTRQVGIGPKSYSCAGSWPIGARSRRTKGMFDMQSKICPSVYPEMIVYITTQNQRYVKQKQRLNDRSLAICACYSAGVDFFTY